MTYKHRMAVVGLVASACLTNAAGLLAADVACSAWRWDTSREQALFRTDAAAVDAAASTETAPRIGTGRLYDAILAPQQKVAFAVAPGKTMLADGTHAGLLQFSVEQAGLYRVAIDQHSWLDVLHEGRALPSKDFQGSPGCAPQKMVIYELPAQAMLLLQISGNPTDHVRLTITAESRSP